MIRSKYICWHFDYSKNQTIKGIIFLTSLYYVQDFALLVPFEIVLKIGTYTGANRPGEI